MPLGPVPATSSSRIALAARPDLLSSLGPYWWRMAPGDRMTFWLRWAVVDGGGRVHSDMPTVAECEADGWEHAGNDPRYENSVLMRKAEDDD